MKFFLAPLILTILISGTSIPSFAQCATFESTYPILSSLLYVSAPNSAGDRLIVGGFSLSDYMKLGNLVPLPSTSNEQFCSLVNIAPGISAQVYVPTSAERVGDFSPFAGLLLDPASGSVNATTGEVSSGLIPFPGGIIPASRMGNFWSWRTSAVKFAANSGGALTITSSSSLPAPTAGVAYSQQLTAAGGTPPYTWSVAKGTLPTGLSLDATKGIVSGTAAAAIVPPSLATVKLTDAASATFTLTLTFGLAAPSGQSRVGVFSQVAAGAGWETTIYLSNVSTSAALTTVSFRDDDGNSLTLPLTVNVAGSIRSTSASSASGTIPPNSIMTIETTSAGDASLTGWAEVLSSSQLSGYAVFHYTGGAGTPSDGTVPLETSYQTSFAMIYDNTNGQDTGLAVANLSSGSSPLIVTIYDQSGNPIDETGLTWPGQTGLGHISFMLNGQLPKAAGNRGLVVFSTLLDVTAGAQQITGLGLRVTATSSFTSIPKQAAPGQ
jgi:hypothetical protein